MQLFLGEILFVPAEDFHGLVQTVLAEFDVVHKCGGLLPCKGTDILVLIK